MEHSTPASRPTSGHRRPRAPLHFASVAALALSSGGSAIAATRILGSQWRLTAQVREGDTLFVTGPYPYVRQPIYAALFGLVLATGVMFISSSILALAGAVFGAGAV